MPLTNLRRLDAGPPPTVLLWCYLTSHDLVKWLRVSHQTLWNWGQRSSGPPRRQGENRRVLYRFADVLHWMEGPASPTGATRIRSFLAANERGAALATWDMRPDAARVAQRALVRVEAISEAELDALCMALDKVRAFGPKARASVDDNREVAAHG